jgi:hypothetical protein
MIRIASAGALYTAIAAPPSVRQDWSTPAPMSVDEVIRELEARGAHQTDIGDAFRTANPDWLSD